MDDFTPPNLYNLSITSIINHLRWCDYFKSECRSLPDNVLFDLYYKIYEDENFEVLNQELSDLDVFSRIIKVSKKRAQLLKIYQSLVDNGFRVSQNLVSDFTEKSKLKENVNIIDVGLRLGGFLSEIGWYSDSATVLKIVEELCLKCEQNPQTWRKMLECHHKLLHVQAIYCMFTPATKTFNLANDTIELLKKADELPNLAGLYTEFSLLFFIRSEYDKAYKWSIEAMTQLTPNLPPRIILDVLRLASKACVIKRQFKKAGLLIMQAVCLANEFFKSDSQPCYADTLMDYGFYLLNFDSIAHSVQIYNEALEYRKNIFGENNIHTAVAHEDLAYALYVHEYSSGNFTRARLHSERAITILNNLVPTYHLLLASAQRVKALILEEIALDSATHLSENSSQSELLNESEKLHMTALTLAHSAFGEKNVQTAKHYGNLGRLYQSMRKYEDAERMHLRAIAIKEELLGREDYEVGLSIGHLASLYNYHMKQHRKAEKLYYRSIAISLKLFGKTYSGLEYDYRGLLHVYTELKDMDRMLEYYYILSDWKELREKQNHKDINPTNILERPKSIAEITQNFFEMI